MLAYPEGERGACDISGGNIMCVRCALPMLKMAARVWLARFWYRRAARKRLQVGMDVSEIKAAATGDGISQAPRSGATQTEQAKASKLVLLVRHGQTTFNVEGRLPGQLPGVLLTDEGRRQAQRAAISLSGLPLSVVISSPLERARETAEIIARGWALPVRTDARLMDTDVSRWAGQKLEDIARTDPQWKAFVEHPTQPFDGAETLTSVQARAVAAVEAALSESLTGGYLLFVAHADIVKVILAHFTGMALDCARFLTIGNASISALLFEGEEHPRLLGINWTTAPNWLMPSVQAAQAQSIATPPGSPTGAPEQVVPTASSGPDHV